VGVAGGVQANERDKLKLATVMRENLSYTQFELKPRKSIFPPFGNNSSIESWFYQQS
jgi:hypothetical protein